jgi:prepilin-type N-terminal cleavage/methylation domain-containing protein
MKTKRAFTLIELMVTVAIIAILTGVAAISYQGVRQRARDAQRSNDLNQLKISLTSYYQAQIPQAYPISTTKVTLNDTTDVLATALKPNFVRNIALDPLNTGNYVYKYQSNSTGTDYTLFATLENVNNTKGWAGGSAWAVDGFQVKPD